MTIFGNLRVTRSKFLLLTLILLISPVSYSFPMLFQSDSSVNHSPLCQVARCDSPSKMWTAPIQSEWTLDVRGERSDFVNIYFHGKLIEFEELLHAAGWVESAPNNKQDDSQYVKSAVLYERYKAEMIAIEHLRMLNHLKSTPEMEAQIRMRMSALNKTIQAMPVSNQTFCGKMQVAAFENHNLILGGRHHLRIFATDQTDSQNLPVFAIATSLDIGIIFDRERPRQAFLNHKIEANTDHERDTVLTDLLATGTLLVSQAHPVAFQCAVPETGAMSKDQKVIEIF